MRLFEGVCWMGGNTKGFAIEGEVCLLTAH